MVLYAFKSIQVVPNGKDFVDIVLTRTQRKTPTTVHKHWPIAVVRKFYMRKVKYTAATINEKEIHPFYADLINVLYDKDHYKLALGQLNTARHLVDNVAKDYVRLLKFGDSLYRCKQLKRAALGRMVKVLKRLGSSLGYLEDVRQHLARLPTIDPATRTLLICGFPNVGKSSFMKKVTRVDAEVQPYAFTTKSLFVGHMDYKYLRWQVIDTPGILDHPLEDRNTIEMQSITALAHLRCCILYFMDISEQCGYSIAQQVTLFESIAPLFANKPIVIALNKVDQRRPDTLEPLEQAAIKKILADFPGTQAIPMSTISEEGISLVKETACEMLLQLRADLKLNSAKRDDIAKRLHVSVPVPRDDKKREAFIPEAKARGHDGKVARRKLAEFETQSELYKNFDPSYKGVDQRDNYDLEQADWRYDVIPEFMDGMNVMDYYEPEIAAKLAELEVEETERLAELEALDKDDEAYPALSAELMAKVKKIREAKKLVILEHRLMKQSRTTPIPNAKMRKHATDLEDHLLNMGINPEKAMESVRERSRSRSHSRGRKRGREEMEVEDSTKKGRSVSKTPKPGEGLRDLKQKLVAEMLERKAQRSIFKQGRVAESDRRIPNLRPQHLFSGKRGIGKTDRR